MKKFYLKAFVFYTTAVICCLGITGITTVAAYLFLHAIGIPEFGQFIQFKVGLAAAEVCGCVGIVADLSDKVLYYDEEEEERQEEYRKVFDEEF